MRRRDTLAFIVAPGASPLRTQGQQAGKVYRIAWLSNTICLHAIVDGVCRGHARARVDRGPELHRREPDLRGHSERFPALAAEAVQRKVDLIVCAGTPPTSAAKNATSTIPILFYYVGDPVGSGFVASLARPGGNITGLGGLSPAIYAKQLELLKEAVPNASRIAVLFNPTLHHAGIRAETESAAQSLSVTLRSVELRSPRRARRRVCEIARDKPDALLILGQPFLSAAARTACPSLRSSSGCRRCSVRRQCRGRPPHVVRRPGRRRRSTPAALRGPHLEGRETGRSAGRAAEPVLPHHQPEDREGDRRDRAAFAAARADQVIE